jgi:hypothetical protein
VTVRQEIEVEGRCERLIASTTESAIQVYVSSVADPHNFWVQVSKPLFSLYISNHLSFEVSSFSPMKYHNLKFNDVAVDKQ